MAGINETSLVAPIGEEPPARARRVLGAKKHLVGSKLVHALADEIEKLRAELERFHNGAYDATEQEVSDLRRALCQIGHAAPQSNETLGFEWIRYAKRVVHHVAATRNERN